METERYRLRVWRPDVQQAKQDHVQLCGGKGAWPQPPSPRVLGRHRDEPVHWIWHRLEMPNKHAAGLFEIYNKDSGSEQHRHHAVEVAVHNVLSYLYEIESGGIYKMQRQHKVYSGLGGKETTSGEKEKDGDEPTAQEDEDDEADQVDGDKSKAANEIYKTTTTTEEVSDESPVPEKESNEEKQPEEPIQSIDTPAVREMKTKKLTPEEQLAQGDGKYDSDDDEDEEEEPAHQPDAPFGAPGCSNAVAAAVA